MRYEKLDEIWEALRQHRNGATARQLANQMHKPLPNISSRLSRFYYYGYAERIPTGGPYKEYRYRLRRSV